MDPDFQCIFLIEILCNEYQFHFRPELLRPSQVVQPSPPNPPTVTSHPSGMATSVIRISPNPARGGPLTASAIANSQQQQPQPTSWRVESPGAPSYSEATNQQPISSFPSVVTSVTQQQQQQLQQHQHQQGLILQQALTSSPDVNSSSQHHVEGPRPEHSQQHIRVLKPPPQQQNLTVMQMPKNEAIDCSPGGTISSSGGNTLYLVPHQSSPQEKKFVVIKSDGDLDKFSTAVMVNRIPAASSSGCLPQSVVVDKAPVSNLYTESELVSLKEYANIEIFQTTQFSLSAVWYQTFGPFAHCYPVSLGEYSVAT